MFNFLSRMIRPILGFIVGAFAIHMVMAFSMNAPRLTEIAPSITPIVGNQGG